MQAAAAQETTIEQAPIVHVVMTPPADSKKAKASRKVVNADDAYLAMCTGSLAISHTSVRCRACEGQGFRELSIEDTTARAAAIAAEVDAKAREQLRKELSAETTCQVCLGIGYTSQRRADRASAMDSMFTTVRCGRCRGCGESSPTDASAEREDRCWACGGDAYIVPVTVKERGSTKSGRAPRRETSDGAYLQDFDTAEPYSYDEPEPDGASRRLAAGIKQACNSDPQLAAAMRSYFGPDGDRWVEHRWGRGFAVWQHTPSGQSLAHQTVELSRRGAGHLCDTTALIASVRESLQLGQLPNTREGSMARQLLGRADTEARELLRRMKGVAALAESAA